MIAIKATNISKIYRIYNSPADRIKEIIMRRPFHSDYIVLENISFSLLKGETLGIIGDNGAGKSTLLKILARTLKPTSGRLESSGRIAALLELGAGFNPELSGEENIYLNAYLMGLSKSEIEMRKDSIIEFSELGDFIKRPVKTYSSGMQVRLAFSIATSVDPEILIVDEALSVGDQHFQKKCVDRMVKFKKENKTIIFCSHSMYLVQELCNRAIWLHKGRIMRTGETKKVINAYTDWSLRQNSKEPLTPVSDDLTSKPVLVETVSIQDATGHDSCEFKTGDDIILTFRLKTNKPGIKGHLGIALNRNDGESIYTFSTKMDGYDPISFEDGRLLSLQMPDLPLLSGRFFFYIALVDENALHLYDVARSDVFTFENETNEIGIVRINHKWFI